MSTFSREALNGLVNVFLQCAALSYLCIGSDCVYGEHVEKLSSELQNELLEMTEKEQSYRIQWITACDSDAIAAWRQKVIEIDGLHVVRLKEVVREYGWPGYSLVGREGSHAFWFLVQHTPDHLFQSQCLTLLEQAVANSEASVIDLAYLTDRVYMYGGRKQIYGTQLTENLNFYPIEEEENVNERRLAIGLSTLEEYLEVVKGVYKN